METLLIEPCLILTPIMEVGTVFEVLTYGTSDVGWAFFLSFRSIAAIEEVPPKEMFSSNSTSYPRRVPSIIQANAVK